MSELRLDVYTMPAADLGPENPLPPLQGFRNASSAELPEGERGDSAAIDYPDKGQENNPLPYRIQDGYTRERRPRKFKTAVLENQFLRATFLLEMGGRLWSLIHKPSGRELLHVNPVFQPANLAIRNAWFTGGVEWNMGILGHSPLTCSPLFAARVAGGARGQTPILRLYEYERVRRMPFQIDCWLAEDAPILIVRPRLINPHDYYLPMYWWSNIAVDEKPDVRVIGPADAALRHDYSGGIVAQDLPMLKGVDVTYTTNRRSAADLYFKIPENRRAFLAALDGKGRGLFHATTSRMRGRKLWAWGMNEGNRHWQEFLAAPGHAYIEIQGGLATTQSEYRAMPGGAQWAWAEAYGLLEADPKVVHGPWSAATQHVEQKVEQIIPARQLEEELTRTAAWADLPPTEILHHGAGWGALEKRRRDRSGSKPFASDAMPFDDASLTAEQEQWLALLEKGELPAGDPAKGPGSFLVQSEWHTLLEEAIRQNRGDHWLSWYHLGIMRYRAQDRQGARAAWEKSMRLQPTGWAKRNLAQLARDSKDDAAAAQLWLEASRLLPDVVQLAIESCNALLQVRRFKDLLSHQATLPQTVRENWRMQMLSARASLGEGDLEAVRRYFDSDINPASVREQEVALTDIWFEMHEAAAAARQGKPLDEEARRRVRSEFPPPRRIDFRLTLQTDADQSER